MIALPITALTAAILTFFYIFLSLIVINLRRRGVAPSLGTGEDERFLRAVRAHGNFSEYTPLFLILLLLTELSDYSSVLLIIAAALFVTGRFMHALGLLRPHTGVPLRTLGMICTNSALLLLATGLTFFVLTMGAFI